jgi:ankyrin repeat protein
VNRPETTSGLTPLVEAVRARDDGVAAVLLRAGANPNAADRCGATALHHAAGADADTDYVAMLLKNGADPNRLDVNGASPADWARLAGKYARAVQLRHAAFSDMAVE